MDIGTTSVNGLVLDSLGDDPRGVVAKPWGFVWAMCACFAESGEWVDGPATGVSESSSHNSDEIAKRREAMSRCIKQSGVRDIDDMLFTNTAYVVVRGRMVGVVVRVCSVRRKGAVTNIPPCHL